MLSERLKELRNRDGISQKEFATHMFVSQQSIAKWETNKATPNPDMLIAIAEFFNVSVDYLLGKSNIPDLPEQLQERIESEIKKKEAPSTQSAEEALQFLVSHIAGENPSDEDLQHVYELIELFCKKFQKQKD